MKHPPTKAHNYLPVVLAVTMKLEDTGKAYLVDVSHDEWCDLMTSSGFCNCEPKITVTEKAGTVVMKEHESRQ